MKKELDLDVPGVREGKMETHLDILSSSLESSIFKWKPIPKTVKDDMGRDLVTYISEDVYLTEQIDYLIEQGISEKNISARFMSYCVCPILETYGESGSPNTLTLFAKIMSGFSKDNTSVDSLSPLIGIRGALLATCLLKNGDYYE